MKKSNFLLILLSWGMMTVASAQNVGINTTGATPSSNAILDLNTGNAKNVGVLIPRVVLGANLSIFSPPIIGAATGKDSGMLVYNWQSTYQPIGYYYWDGSTWVGINNAKYYTAKDSTLQSTTSSSYQTALSLSLPAGTYIISFSAEFANNHYTDGDTPKGTWYEFTDGTYLYGNSVVNDGDNAGYYVPISLNTTVTFNTSSIVYIKYMEQANNAFKAYIRNAVITAVKIN